MRGASAERARAAALTFYRGRALVGRLSRGELVDASTGVAARLAADPACAAATRSPSSRRTGSRCRRWCWRLLRLGRGDRARSTRPRRPEDWAYILGHSGARGLVASSELARTRGPRRPAGSRRSSLSLDEVAAAGGGAALPDEGRDLADALAIVLYTSGTTGNPEGRRRSASAASSPTRGAWRSNFGLDGTTQLAVLPLYHAHAFGFGLMTACSPAGTSSSPSASIRSPGRTSSAASRSR